MSLAQRWNLRESLSKLSWTGPSVLRTRALAPFAPVALTVEDRDLEVALAARRTDFEMVLPVDVQQHAVVTMRVRSCISSPGQLFAAGRLGPQLKLDLAVASLSTKQVSECKTRPAHY
jgi:hypothetical protein